MAPTQNMAPTQSFSVSMMAAVHVFFLDQWFYSVELPVVVPFAQSSCKKLYTDSSVTKDQSGWGFTVKQGATTTREDSAAYTVSTSRWRQCSLYSLNLQFDNGSGSSHPCWIATGDSKTTHTIILTDSVSLLQKVEWESQTEMCCWLTPTFENSCECTALDMPEWREMTKQIDWQAKQASQVACFSEDLDCWEA